jgi:hypothetical protein
MEIELQDDTGLEPQAAFRHAVTKRLAYALSGLRMQQ